MRIAIDPGASGAIAWTDGEQTRVENMPDTPTGIFEYLQDLSNNEDSIECLVERVGGYMPGNSGPAAVKFARHCGHIDMALIALGIPTLTPVSPQVWQKAVCGALPKEKAERKRAIKDMMQRRYPSLKVTLINADALGILTYMMEKKP